MPRECFYDFWMAFVVLVWEHLGKSLTDEKSQDLAPLSMEFVVDGVRALGRHRVPFLLFLVFSGLDYGSQGDWVVYTMRSCGDEKGR